MAGQPRGGLSRLSRPRHSESKQGVIGEVTNPRPLVAVLGLLRPPSNLDLVSGGVPTKRHSLGCNDVIEVGRGVAAARPQKVALCVLAEAASGRAVTSTVVQPLDLLGDRKIQVEEGQMHRSWSGDG